MRHARLSALVPLWAAAVFAGACGGNPIAPKYDAAPLSGPLSVSGLAVSLQSGQPIAGASLQFTGSGQSTLITDSNGRFTAPAISAGTFALLLEAPGHLTRRSRLSVPASRDDLRLDLISTAPPFSLQFYREFARNGAVSATLEPTRPWTVAPSFYFRNITVDTNETVPDAVIASLRDMMRKSVPELTDHRLALDRFELGSEARVAAAGWVQIEVFGIRSRLGGAIGRASVGGNTGTMQLLYESAVEATWGNAFGCSSQILAIAEHEIVHTMGFWHNSDAASFSSTACSGADRPAKTRHHVAVMYSRPPFNTDPDTDPQTFTLSSAGDRNQQPVAACDLMQVSGGRRARQPR